MSIAWKSPSLLFFYVLFFSFFICYCMHFICYCMSIGWRSRLFFSFIVFVSRFVWSLGFNVLLFVYVFFCIFRYLIFCCIILSEVLGFLFFDECVSLTVKKCFFISFFCYFRVCVLFMWLFGADFYDLENQVWKELQSNENMGKLMASFRALHV